MLNLTSCLLLTVLVYQAVSRTGNENKHIITRFIRLILEMIPHNSHLFCKNICNNYLTTYYKNIIIVVIITAIIMRSCCSIIRDYITVSFDVFVMSCYCCNSVVFL